MKFAGGREGSENGDQELQNFKLRGKKRYPFCSFIYEGYELKKKKKNCLCYVDGRWPPNWCFIRNRTGRTWSTNTVLMLCWQKILYTADSWVRLLRLSPATWCDESSSTQPHPHFILVTWLFMCALYCCLCWTKEPVLPGTCLPDEGRAGPVFCNQLGLGLNPKLALIVCTEIRREWDYKCAPLTSFWWLKQLFVLLSIF